MRWFMRDQPTYQVLSYGGGVQSVTICLLIAQGKLPKPNAIIFADTGREVPMTMEYAKAHVVPMLESIGLTLHVAPPTLRKVDLYGHNGDLLLPVFTKTGKMRAFCSGEWKREVVRRYVRDVLHVNGPYLTWIGFSVDEKRRATDDPKRRYPLLELGLTRSDCIALLQHAGMPVPHKSRCWMCPNQSADSWEEIRAMPELWQQAIALEEDIKAWNEDVWLHFSRIKLRDLPPSTRASTGASTNAPNPASTSLQEPAHDVAFDDSSLRACESGFCFL